MPWMKNLKPFCREDMNPLMDMVYNQKWCNCFYSKQNSALKQALKLPSTDVCRLRLPWGYLWWQSTQAREESDNTLGSICCLFPAPFTKESMSLPIHLESTRPCWKVAWVSSSKERVFWQVWLARFQSKTGKGKLPFFTGKLVQVKSSADKRQAASDPNKYFLFLNCHLQ